MNSPEPTGHPHLHRRFGLLQATALNMSNMLGAGPFFTIPLLMAAMGGPQAMLGWFFAVLITIPDGMIWSELGASMPGSGGSYVYLREGYGTKKWGRLMAFLFIWQFILSGPLEIASGYVGGSNYLRYIWPNLTGLHINLIAVGVGVLNVVLLYRRITFISRLTVGLWLGVLATTATVILAGIPHFDPKLAFDFPEGAFKVSGTFRFGLGAAMRIGIYDYLGYYDICYIGDEVKDPGRVIPRSIMISLIAVALIYFTMNLSIIGVVPWREFVPVSADNPTSQFVVSIFMEKIFGRSFSMLFTVMILWTAFASVFALLLGYSRIPYAAARDGYFFNVFDRLHPVQGFPYVSLLLIGLLSAICSFLSLQTIIDALVSIRILVQFVGQIFAVMLLRRMQPNMERPYKIWLYPLPSVLAFLGWMFVLVTSETKILLSGGVFLVAGLVAFLVWSGWNRSWPFGDAEKA